MASEDTTAPIEIATGRRLPFGGLSGPATDPDSPISKGWDPSSSTLIRQHTENILETARTEKPTPDQLARLHGDVSALAMLADRGLAALGVPSGNGRTSNLGAVIVSAIVSAGIALGIPGLSNQDLSPRLTAIETRSTEIEADQLKQESRSRKIDALTIRWLADQQQDQCKSLKVIAEGIEALKPKPKSGDEKPASPAPIECDQSNMPPELLALVAQSRIDESQ
jgi:hypothetical protein